jgi:hypothetical protein
MTTPFRFLADAFDVSRARELGERPAPPRISGVTTFVLPDHLVGQPAPVPYLAAVAALTERIRISAFVHNNDLRHPAVLAQELATLDLLSEGRLDVAIGAGWNQAEYTAIGLPFDPAGSGRPGWPSRSRSSRAASAPTRSRSPVSTTRSPTTTRSRSRCSSRTRRSSSVVAAGPPWSWPLARRRPSAFAPRILRGGVPDPRSFTWAATEEKIGWVREAAGERFDQLTLNVYPSFWPTTVTDDLDGEARKVAARMKERSGIELTVPEVIDSPHIFIGSHDRFVEKFTELRGRLGISSFLISDLDQLGPVVEQLAGT